MGTSGWRPERTPVRVAGELTPVKDYRGRGPPQPALRKARLRSSIARCGLNALLSNYCDPGWHGSTLTLELHNVNQHHALLVTEGLLVGQMIFDLVDAVPEDRSYATVGRYNRQSGATESLGAR